MNLFKPRDKVLKALVDIFIGIAKDIYEHREVEGVLHQEVTVYNLPIRIRIDWGNHLLDDEDTERGDPTP